MFLAVMTVACVQDVAAETSFVRKPKRKRTTALEAVTPLPAARREETSAAVREPADSVATTKDKDTVVVKTESQQQHRQRNDAALKVELTPSQMDSLAALWSEEANGRAFDRFFDNFISFDVSAAAASSLPDSVYIERLRALVSPVQLPFNPIVKNYISRYVDGRYGTINRILSLSQYYFPIIEDELLREGLPVELRALPIIESALMPQAVSVRGAAGLWQFMPYTGKSYGLEVNSLVDERCDAVLSTRAACRFLRDLYNIYNDWTLAIAAYNCGPGNVNKALSRAGSDCKTFWDIYYYLPPETRGYVPAFIGASYAYAYHRLHNIKVEPSPLPVATDTITVRRIMHLGQVAETLDIPMDMLRKLNPQYKMDIIPATTRSYSLVLPLQYVSKYVERESDIFSKDSTYLKEYINPANIDRKRLERPGFTYTVKNGDTLSGIAYKYRISVKEIMRWNNLRSTKLRIGQKLRIERAR